MCVTGLACVVCSGRLGVCSTQTHGDVVTRYRKCLGCGRRVVSEERIVRDGRIPPEVNDAAQKENHKEE